jgi:hypothetical protein
MTGAHPFKFFEEYRYLEAKIEERTNQLEELEEKLHQAQSQKNSALEKKAKDEIDKIKQDGYDEELSIYNYLN